MSFFGVILLFENILEIRVAILWKCQQLDIYEPISSNHAKHVDRDADVSAKLCVVASAHGAPVTGHVFFMVGNFFSTTVAVWVYAVDDFDIRTPE